MLHYVRSSEYATPLSIYPSILEPLIQSRNQPKHALIEKSKSQKYTPWIDQEIG